MAGCIEWVGWRWMMKGELARAGAFHSTFYTQYIESDDWAKRRADYYRSHRRVCRGCKSRKLIHLHHHTYERLGNELDTDLIPLCHRCHEEVHLYHDLHKTEQSLTNSTFKWLATKSPKPKRKPAKPKRAPRPPAGKSDPVNDAFRRIMESRRSVKQSGKRGGV